jgi:uncharacterized cupin superfamily protein
MAPGRGVRTPRVAASSARGRSDVRVGGDAQGAQARGQPLGAGLLVVGTMPLAATRPRPILACMAKKIDLSSAPIRVGSAYPAPFDAPCATRTKQRLGVAAGLTQFGVNRLRLQPGSWSSQRHWHVQEDELVYVLEGEVVLVTDAGEETLRAGDSAGFKAGERDGHHLQNRSDREAVLLEVGSCFPGGDTAEYSDIDMRVLPEGFVHKDGTPYGAAPKKG